MKALPRIAGNLCVLLPDLVAQDLHGNVVLGERSAERVLVVGNALRHERKRPNRSDVVALLILEDLGPSGRERSRLADSDIRRYSLSTTEFFSSRWTVIPATLDRTENSPT